MFDHIHAGLCALMELRQYKVYLQSSPHQAAALLAECDGGSAEQDLKNSILQAMKLEWNLVVEAENSLKLHHLMRSSCPHTRFVYYREVMSCFEKEGWALNSTTEALVRAWFPRLSSSCNVEQCFNHMEDSIKRATKASSASVPNPRHSRRGKQGMPRREDRTSNHAVSGRLRGKRGQGHKGECLEG